MNQPLPESIPLFVKVEKSQEISKLKIQRKKLELFEKTISWLEENKLEEREPIQVTKQL
jgi:hypothetical protein